MANFNPLQGHVCALIILIGCITTYLSYKRKSAAYGEYFPNGTNISVTNLKDAKMFKNYRNYFKIPNLMQNGSSSNDDIYILGLFELSTKWGVREEGLSELAAANLAIEHVNEFQILPGYSLKLMANDTKCDPGVGVDNFFHAIYSNKVVLMVLGSGCSNVTESLANIMSYWNILQVSYGSTSPILSDRNRFPLFFRTVAPDSSHNAARISFIKHFGWKMVATFNLSQQPFQLSSNRFVRELEASDVYCVAMITFSMENYKEQLRVLKSNIEFEEQLNISKINVSKHAPQTYDAIWTMALILRESTLCKHSGYLTKFNYNNPDMVKKFVTSMASLKFIGISGPVKFDGADRIGNSILKQLQNGNLSTVAIYYAENGFLDFECLQCSNIKWHGGETPIDQRILKFRLVTIPKLAFFVVFGFATFGIILSMVLLYFNLHFKKRHAFKLSSPRLNNFVVFGCILVYLAVVFLGFDQGNAFFDINQSHLCTIRVYLFSTGFSLTFGSIFAKTYRVHRIFTYSATSLIKDKLLKDKQLIALICVLLIIDGAIVLLWIMVDPLKKTLKDLPIEINLENKGLAYQPQVEVCRSENTTGWFVVIYSYKGFLLIMGVYMAWETRHIKIPSLNDSKYIGICVYSVVSSSTVVLLLNFLSDYTTVSFLVTSLSILASTTITLLLLFTPKLRAVLSESDGENSIAQSMGLKIEYNTRRFLIEDHREVLYRIEVQNKVYKTELETLDKEIARLEQLLKSSTADSTGKDQVCKGIVFLPVPISSQFRASWPSTHSNGFKNQFLSEKELHEPPNEQKLKICDRLKGFFGSIPSMWMFNFVHEKTIGDGVDKNEKRETKSFPEGCIRSEIIEMSPIRSAASYEVGRY
ncbi:gamma-aminobutyric acid type B receptor subunit 2-like isoform X2 [Photinus pyralis]|uniref:gamma-aminobutyric acid type B receptor subunit 2-like isoform X2 n=1 Tax=Photinus pyralis TaxID=7054 RepID=UPI001267300B|nr:gamma-aminobutyric acid type B receptor subunit 2-like isoform X2 [Photinus pyralis]